MVISRIFDYVHKLKFNIKQNNSIVGNYFGGEIFGDFIIIYHNQTSHFDSLNDSNLPN